MSIFGDLDASKVNANPYYVRAGEYEAVISNAYKHFNKDKDKHQLVIEYKITDADDDENREYIGRTVSDWFDIFPELTEEDLNEMDPEEKGRINKAMGAVKRRLCGFTRGNKEFPGLRVPEEDLDESWDPKSLKDVEVDLGVINTGDDEEFSNVRWVTAKE